MGERYRTYREEGLWNGVSIAAFVVIAAYGYFCLAARDMLPERIGLFDFAILVLATQRLIRLVCYDSILRFARDRFLDRSVTRQLEDAEPEVMFESSTSGFRRVVYHLLGCPWCSGIWVALLSTFSFFAFPELWILFLILAVASLSSLLQVGANFLGWRAERQKQKVEGEHRK